jgi:transcriptional regulator with PAS, ATPase and Fis domain
MMDININFSDGIFGSTEFFRIDDFALNTDPHHRTEAAIEIISRSIYDNPLCKNMLDAMNIGVNIVGINRKVLYVNWEQSHIHNIPAEEYVGKVIDSITPMSGHIHVLKNGKRFHNDELAICMKRLVKVRTICIPILDKNDVLLGSFGLAKALSDYREVLLEVKSFRNMRSNFSYIYDDNPSPIIALDVVGKVLYKNHAFTEVVSAAALKTPDGQKELNALGDIAKITLSEMDKNFIHFVKMQNNEYKVTTLPFAVNGELKGCICFLRGVKTFAKPKPLIVSREDIGQTQHAKSELSQPFQGIIGENRALLEQLLIADRAAPTDCTILISGSSGSGKELVANAIHRASERAPEAFVTINCGAVPENLLESELFGYEDGAFTGAKKGGKPGKFELAHKGTLFLDEIGDMSLVMQVKLLRILEDMENERVGGVKKSKLDVRILAATNRNLRQMIAEDKFREDLFYRLNIVSLRLPALCDRRDDIPLLVRHFVKKFSLKYNKKVDIADSTMKILKKYHWPGSVRELKNILENIVVLSNSNYIQPYHLPPTIWDSREQLVAGEDAPAARAARAEDRNEGRNIEKGDTLITLREQAEKIAILQVLRDNNYNRTKAMAALGISRRTFYNKLNKYHIIAPATKY